MKFIADKFKNNYAPLMGDPLVKLSMYDDIINLSIGDPDINCDKRIIEYGYEKLKEGKTHYTLPQGLNELKDGIIEFYFNEYNKKLTRENIFITTSASHAMYLTMKAILNEGDEVIIPSPFFSSYKDQVSLNGGKCVFLETKEEDGFEVQEADLLKCINEKTKALIINTPNNPTGAVYSNENLKMLARVAKEHDILVIADDIYTCYMKYDTFTSISAFMDDFSNVLIIRSFSKDYAMTGFRIGYLVGDPKLVSLCKNINDSVVYSAPTHSQFCALKALKLHHEITSEVWGVMLKRLNFMEEAISKSKWFSSIKIKGGMYVFMNITKTKMTSQEFVDYVFEKAHVILLPGSVFGPGGEGFVRIAMSVDVSLLEEAFNRLENLDYKL